MAQRLLAPPLSSPSPLRVCGVFSSPFSLFLSRLRFPLSLLFSPSYPFQFRSDVLIYIYTHIWSIWLRPVPLARVPTSTLSAHV